MNHPKRIPDPAAKGRRYLEETDIGSGDKTPGEQETEEMIRQIPPLPYPGQQAEHDAASQQGSQNNQAPAAPAGKR